MLLPAIDALRVIYVVGVVLMGLMYAGIGVALGVRTDLRLGCWRIGTGIIATLLSTPATMLAIAILGGLGLLLASRASAPHRSSSGSEAANAEAVP